MMRKQPPFAAITPLVIEPSFFDPLRGRALLMGSSSVIRIQPTITAISPLVIESSFFDPVKEEDIINGVIIHNM